MNKLIKQVEEYVQDALGIQVALAPWSKGAGLPLYLRDRYNFFTTSMLGTPCLIMVDIGKAMPTPAVIAKHMKKLGNQVDVELVYVRTAVDSYIRKRLVEQKIPFIVPGNQMYLPMMGIDFREHMKRLREGKELFSPATQVLILHVLSGKTGDTITPGKIARQLQYSAMTMTRVFDELAEIGIGEQVVRRKSRKLHFPVTGRHLWAEVLPYLTAPVKKQLYVSCLSPKKYDVLAGESALAHYTSLAAPKVPTYAFSAARWRYRFHREDITVIPYAEPGSVEIEIWKYDPNCLAEAGIADRLSLYLSLKDTADERVQSALETLLGDMSW